MSRRGVVEINYCILYLLKRDGSLKSTHLMYRANLNHVKVKLYCNRLIAAGYVQFAGKRYFLTEKGLLFLSISREFFALGQESTKDYREREVLIVK